MASNSATMVGMATTAVEADLRDRYMRVLRAGDDARSALAAIVRLRMEVASDEPVGMTAGRAEKLAEDLAEALVDLATMLTGKMVSAGIITDTYTLADLEVDETPDPDYVPGEY